MATALHTPPLPLPTGDFRQGHNFLVVWRVTTSCNLGCRFCGYNRGSGAVRQHTTPTAVLNFGKALVEHGAAIGEDVRVSWLGGEPFLWRPIHDVSRSLAEAGISLSATTNGTALSTRNVIETVRSHFDVIHVSLDGVGQEHDRSRESPGLYERVLSNISRLVEGQEHLQVGVNLLLTAESIHDIERLCRQLGDAGATFLSFNPLIVDEGTPEADRKLSVLDLPLLDELFEDRSNLLARTGVRLLGSSRYFDRVRSYVLGTTVGVGVEDCRPGRYRLLIDEHGRVQPCSFVTGTAKPVFVSDVRTAAEVSALDARFAEGVASTDPTACRDCMDPFVFGKFESWAT